MRDLAIVFPGQGAQYIGMGKAFYDDFDYVQNIYKEASDALGFDLTELIFNGTEEELKDTKNAQPAILTVSYASYQVFLREFGLKPAVVAGHSLGEISALTAAGIIDFHDAVKIVKKRGELMGAAMPENNGAMAAVSRIKGELLWQICQDVSNGTDTIEVSNYNSESQLVISGDKGLINKAIEVIKKQKGKASLLKVSTAFHSAYMKEAGEKFGEELSKYQFKQFDNMRVLSNVTADFYKDSTQIIPLLTRQIYSPVRWSEIIERIRTECGQAIEMFPKNILSNMIKKDKLDFRISKFETKADFKPAIEQLLPNSLLVTKAEFFERLIAVSVCTQNNNFDNEEYERGVVQPYREIQALNAKYMESGNAITVEDMKKGVDLLKLIFDTKKTDEEIQKERFHRIILETETREILLDYIEAKFQ